MFSVVSPVPRTDGHIVGAEEIFVERGMVHNCACIQVNNIKCIFTTGFSSKKALTDLLRFDPISHPSPYPNFCTEFWNSQYVINTLPLSSPSRGNIWPPCSDRSLGVKLRRNFRARRRGCFPSSFSCLF